MPGNQNPLDLAKSTETKVVRRVGRSETQCYIAKAYKIPQNYGCDSPFFGSILTKLIPETEPVTCAMIPALPSLKVGISLFRFPSRTMTSGGIRKRLLHCSAALSLGALAVL